MCVRANFPANKPAAKFSTLSPIRGGRRNGRVALNSGHLNVNSQGVLLAATSTGLFLHPIWRGKAAMATSRVHYPARSELCWEGIFGREEAFKHANSAGSQKQDILFELWVEYAARLGGLSSEPAMKAAPNPRGGRDEAR